MLKSCTLSYSFNSLKPTDEKQAGIGIFNSIFNLYKRQNDLRNKPLSLQVTYHWRSKGNFELHLFGWGQHAARWMDTEHGVYIRNTIRLLIQLIHIRHIWLINHPLEWQLNITVGEKKKKFHFSNYSVFLCSIKGDPQVKPTCLIKQLIVSSLALFKLFGSLKAVPCYRDFRGSIFTA